MNLLHQLINSNPDMPSSGWAVACDRPEIFIGEFLMATKATSADFITAVAGEMSAGIDRALRYWLGRIELEAIDRSLPTAARLLAIQQILDEYKALAGRYES
jgi:hypothetical protein